MNDFLMFVNNYLLYKNEINKIKVPYHGKGRSQRPKHLDSISMYSDIGKLN